VNVLIGIAFLVVPIAVLVGVDWIFAGRRRTKAEAAGRNEAGTDASTNFRAIESRSNSTRNSSGFL
jgi:hypothetical protein